MALLVELVLIEQLLLVGMLAWALLAWAHPHLGRVHCDGSWG
jgi:hypothetical protein